MDGISVLLGIEGGLLWLFDGLLIKVTNELRKEMVGCGRILIESCQTITSTHGYIGKW